MTSIEIIKYICAVSCVAVPIVSMVILYIVCRNAPFDPNDPANADITETQR